MGWGTHFVLLTQKFARKLAIQTIGLQFPRKSNSEAQIIINIIYFKYFCLEYIIMKNKFINQFPVYKFPAAFCKCLKSLDTFMLAFIKETFHFCAKIRCFAVVKKDDKEWHQWSLRLFGSECGPKWKQAINYYNLSTDYLIWPHKRNTYF